jgi:O-antigen ligase
MSLQARPDAVADLSPAAGREVPFAGPAGRQLRGLTVIWGLIVFCAGVPLTFLDISALIHRTEHTLGVNVLSSVLGELVRVSSVRYLVFGLGLVVGMVAMRRYGILAEAVGSWMVPYTVWASMSVAWSGNATLATVKVISLWSAIVVTAALRLRAGKSTAVVVTFMWAATMVLLSAVLVALVSPEFGIMGALDRYARLGGEYIYPNTLGQYAGMLFVLLWYWPTAWRPWVLVTLRITSLLVLLLTQSRTSLAATLAALIIVKLLTVHVAMRLGAIALLALVSLGLVVGDVELGGTLGWFGRGSADEAFDMAIMRMDVWRDALERGAERPLVGHGFATGSRLLLSSQRTRSGYEWQPLHTHNAFVETYLNLGAVGVVLLILMVGSVAVRLARLMRADGVVRQRATAAAGLLTFVLVVGLSESSYAGELGQAFIGLLVCAVVGADARRDVSSEVAAVQPA